MVMVGMLSAGLVLLGSPPHPSPLVGMEPSSSHFPGEVFMPRKRWAVLKTIEQLESRVRLQSLPAPVVLPFDQVDQHILVKAQLTGVSEPIPLILDSGVRSLVLQRSLLPQIPLQNQVQITPEATFGLIDQVSLGTVQFRQVGAYAVAFSTPGDPLQCLSKYGVLGARMMGQGVWRIDYRARTITVAESLTQLIQAEAEPVSTWLETAIKIPVYLRDNRPFIHLDLGHGNLVDAMVDTGWGGSIRLTQGHLPDSVLASVPAATVEGQIETLQGLNSFEHKIVQIPNLALGPLTLPNFLVQVSDELSGPGGALIGNDFLHHFVVTIDWPQQTLYLEPIDVVDALYLQVEGYGFQSLVRNQRLVVTGLYHPSPADDAGLQIGDQIMDINGDDYAAIPTDLACHYIYHPIGELYQGSITVTVLREGNLLTLELSPGVIL